MAEVWIVEGRPHPDSKWFPFYFVFETEAGAIKGRRELIEARPEFEYRAVSYFRLRREDLEWARLHLSAHVKSESLERIIEALE